MTVRTNMRGEVIQAEAPKKHPNCSQRNRWRHCEGDWYPAGKDSNGVQRWKYLCSYKYCSFSTGTERY